MNSAFILHPKAVCSAAGTQKEAVLAELARCMAGAYDLDAAPVLDALLKREELGSTGFGRGVALPHAHMSGIHRPIAAIVRLEAPVQFDAVDGLPVDLLVGLLSPEDAGTAHLHALAALSRMIRKDEFHRTLSQAPDADALFALVNNASDRDAA